MQMLINDFDQIFTKGMTFYYNGEKLHVPKCNGFKVS